MKKLLLICSLLAISNNALAWKMLNTEAEFLVNAGVGQDNTTSIKFTGQEKECYRAKYLCFNVSAMWLFNESGTGEFSDAITLVGGGDVKYKFPKGSNNSYYVEAGPYYFTKDFKGRRLNGHVGAGIEYRRVIVSIDAYGTNDPVYMGNVGYRF